MRKLVNRLRVLKNFTINSTRGIAHEFFGQGESFLNDAYRSHEGETCFVIGNGPSLKDIPDQLLGQLPSFGTNGIFLKFLPTYYLTISLDFYKNHQDAIRSLKCKRKFIGDSLTELCTSDYHESVLNCSWNIYGSVCGFNFPVPLRFSKYPNRVVYLGGTVLFVCLQIAYWMGFSRVILLGVDHNFGFHRSEAVYGGRRVEIGMKDHIHFNEAYSKPGYTPHCDMLAIERSFQLAYNAFKVDGREIVNATPNTGLDVIPKANLEDLL